MATSGNQSTGSGHDAAFGRLRDAVQRAHLIAGEPSTRSLASQVKAFSHTTVAAVLRCDRLPRWGQVELVVEALDSDVREFKRLWIAARTEQRNQQPRAGRATPSPPMGRQGEEEAQVGTDVDLRVRFLRHHKVEHVEMQAYLGNVDCGQLVEWYGSHRERLFENVRQPPVSASLVRDITAMLDSGRPEHLPIRLNGITIIATGARVAIGGSVDGPLELIASRAQIVKDAGITVALSHVARNASYDLRRLQILARIIVACHREPRAMA
jgi:hypothetical protein